MAVKKNKYDFESFLQLSEKMRKGYISSLNKPENDWEEKFELKFKHIPTLLTEIYSKCGGTDPNIEDNKLFDFIPEYRLMTATEVLQSYEQINEFYNSNEYDCLIAFLQDYSGNFIAYAKRGDVGQIVSLVPEEGIVVMHDSVEKFWETINKFYTEKVYFPDEDGYLSYDFDLEGEVGAEVNEGVEYWNE